MFSNIPFTTNVERERDNSSWMCSFIIDYDDCNDLCHHRRERVEYFLYTRIKLGPQLSRPADRWLTDLKENLADQYGDFIPVAPSCLAKLKFRPPDVKLVQLGKKNNKCCEVDEWAVFCVWPPRVGVYWPAACERIRSWLSGHNSDGQKL